jgi:hypothetical protein
MLCVRCAGDQLLRNPALDCVGLQTFGEFLGFLQYVFWKNYDFVSGFVIKNCSLAHAASGFYQPVSVEGNDGTPTEAST